MSLRGIITAGASRYGQRQATKLSGEATEFRLRLYSTYYDVFPKTLGAGPPPKGRFDINTVQLKREFLQLQSATHPDKAHQNEALRRDYEGKSAQLNMAYTTLLSPLLRAQHLLLAQGIDALSEKDSLVDEDLLMHVMSAREALEEATSADELEPLKQENDKLFAETEQALVRAFQEEDYEAAKAETIKLSYWQNIRNQIKEAGFD